MPSTRAQRAHSPLLGATDCLLSRACLLAAHEMRHPTCASSLLTSFGGTQGTSTVDQCHDNEQEVTSDRADCTLATNAFLGDDVRGRQSPQSPADGGGGGGIVHSRSSVILSICSKMSSSDSAGRETTVDS